MKRILGMILVMGMLASVAMAATNVTSVNAVGYNSVTIEPGEVALVCLPFETFDDSTLENLVGDQLPTLSWAYIWTGSGYASSQRNARGTWTGTNVILRGDAFWLAPAGTETNTVTFLGEVPDDYNDAGTTTVYSITSDAVGYAYPTDVQWTNTTLAQNMANTTSWMYFWDPSSGWDSYSKNARGVWSTPAGFEIPAGRGFFVNSDSPIDWTEIVPYDLGE